MLFILSRVQLTARIPLTPPRPFLLFTKGQVEGMARNLEFILGYINTVQSACVWCVLFMCHLHWQDTTFKDDTNYSEVLIWLPPNAWESSVCLSGMQVFYDTALFFFFLSSLFFSWNCRILSWQSLNPGLQWFLFIWPHIKHIFHASPNQTQKVPINKLMGKKSVGSIKATCLEALGAHFDWVKADLQRLRNEVLYHTFLEA